MGVILKILIYLYLCTGLQCAQQISWLPCVFTDEHVSLNAENHIETQFYPRQAGLQFGQTGDTPVNPHIMTFLVTSSKVDLRSYTQEATADQLECELRRYSTDSIQMRWPVHGAQEYDRWFTCTLKHTEGLFTVTGFLRHTPSHAPALQEDYLSRPAFGDRDVLTTSASMVLLTRTPSVQAGLRSDQKLHCQFAVDHKAANVNVEWNVQRRGDRTRLYSYGSRSGKTQGTGVRLKGLAEGDASFSLPHVKITDEGTYVCSVSVPPLFASQDIILHIIEPPRVSINIGPALSLQEGGEQKVVCEAEGYYPLDVEMEWYQEDPGASGQRVGASLPKKLQNVLLSSHKHNMEGTYTLSAFFYLQPSLRDSGSQFSCRVSHSSLRMPIRKSFTLTVQEPASWMFHLAVGFTVITLLVILCLMLSHLHSARCESMKSKPY
ncbi:tapasin-related protein [Polymixia lowei]